MRFQVFSNGEMTRIFRPCGAYLFGTDGISVRRARITFKHGCIECDRPNLETAGLALLWPTGQSGRILLPTTCLPERNRPYNLNVEVTRAKLMQITNRREDWAFFDGVEGMEDVLKESQSLFIEAIQQVNDGPAASRLADEALDKAMLYSEQLSAHQGALAFDKRRKASAFSRGALGCRIAPSLMTNPRYVERLLGLFSSVVVPINWAQVEMRQGRYDFAALDDCISLLKRRKLVIGAGPLLQFTKDHLPDWLLRSGAGFEKIREFAYEFVSRVVARYAGYVHRWYAISGLNAFNQFNFNFEQILEMTRAANMAVRTAGSRAVRVVEVASPWGEYYATTPNSIPPFVYMDMVVQSGTSFDAFGLQMRFGKDEPGMHLRDMMQISSILDCLVPIAKPIHITGIEVPSVNGKGKFDGKVAGVWNKKWDEKRQSQWLEQFYKIALSKTSVEVVNCAGLVDADDNVIANSGLLTNRFEPKKAYETLKELNLSILRG